jgi:hypothetical protein
MSDINFFDGIDPDDEIGMQDARLQSALRENSRRQAALDAIHMAHGIEHEVTGDAPGYILHYLRDMREQAVNAMSQLVKGAAMSEEARLAAKLQIQPYAHLMHWVDEKLATGREKQKELDDIDRLMAGED